MSDEPEIPVPPEPTTHDILKALLAQTESLNGAINKSAPFTAPSVQEQGEQLAKEIEKSLLELHQVFLDMAVMVEAQGEQMDDIEHHVVNAPHHVKDGTKSLHSAKGYQGSSRKWFCIGFIQLMLTILVIIIPIATSLFHS
ncbi:hypothetical protein MRB53_032543 [Persea americana]|uniref:Uncharacterized protein n=1 Tax=Persea americana TaxID=3435 RepID=A0ACC2KSQ5_PERAE|nr:hypothetical protein MRB53_032543 [Persea americana]